MTQDGLALCVVGGDIERAPLVLVLCPGNIIVFAIFKKLEYCFEFLDLELLSIASLSLLIWIISLDLGLLNCGGLHFWESIT